MKNLIIDPRTDDLRKEVMYVAYAIAIFIVVCCVLLAREAIMNPQNISFGMMD